MRRGASCPIPWQMSGTSPRRLLQCRALAEPRSLRSLSGPGLRIPGPQTRQPRGSFRSRLHSLIAPSRMAEPTQVAPEAAPAIPSDDAIARAARFTREPFLLEGEDAAAQLAPGSARRGALDAALAELDAGAAV